MKYHHEELLEHSQVCSLEAEDGGRGIGFFVSTNYMVLNVSVLNSSRHQNRREETPTKKMFIFPSTQPLGFLAQGRWITPSLLNIFKQT